MRLSGDVCNLLMRNTVSQCILDLHLDYKFKLTSPKGIRGGNQEVENMAQKAERNFIGEGADIFYSALYCKYISFETQCYSFKMHNYKR